MCGKRTTYYVCINKITASTNTSSHTTHYITCIILALSANLHTLAPHSGLTNPHQQYPVSTFTNTSTPLPPIQSILFHLNHPKNFSFKFQPHARKYDPNIVLNSNRP